MLRDLVPDVWVIDRLATASQSCPCERMQVASLEEDMRRWSSDETVRSACRETPACQPGEEEAFLSGLRKICLDVEAGRHDEAGISRLLEFLGLVIQHRIPGLRDELRRLQEAA